MLPPQLQWCGYHREERGPMLALSRADTNRRQRVLLKPAATLQEGFASSCIVEVTGGQGRHWLVLSVAPGSESRALLVSPLGPAPFLQNFGGWEIISPMRDVIYILENIVFNGDIK